LDGKKVIFIIIIISIIAGVLTWIFGQKVIEEQELESASSILKELSHYINITS